MSSSSIHHFAVPASVPTMSGSPSTPIRSPSKPITDVTELLKKLDVTATIAKAKATQEKYRIRMVKELENNSSITISGIGDTAMTALCKAFHQRPLPRLEKLLLLYNRLTQKSMWDFARAVGTGNLSSLKVLNLTMNLGFGDPGAKALAKAIESGKLRSLEELIIMNDNIGEQGLIAISDALERGNVSSLRLLRIGNNVADSYLFHNQGAKALAAAVRSNSLPHLEDLLFRGVAGEEGIIHLLKALETSNVGAFQQLDLRVCDLGVRGTKALADMLKAPQFSTLTVLDIQNNVSMGDDGVIELSAALRSGNLKNLKVLYLDNVSMSSRGLLALASLLEEGHLPGLQELFAGASEYTETSAKALVKAYQENKSLVARIMVDWPSTSWGNQVEVLRERNIKLLTSSTDAESTKLGTQSEASSA
ncbi:hypothetical protein R1flu_004154 [Riccia fluitans]|uniref:Uncharacterized protein n=1 Tax=Riccia fluitans TaxID=41844 RepID=A0ABD1YPH3_9MARC